MTSSERQKEKNTLEEQEKLARALLIFVGLMFFFYNVCVKYLNIWLHMNGDIVINVCVSLFFLLSSCLFAVRYHIHTWHHRIHTKTVIRNCFDALSYSMIVILCIVLLKILLLYAHHLPIDGDHIFQPRILFVMNHQTFHRSWYFYYLGFYLVSAALQEIVARGVIQNTLEKIFAGSSRWWPILVVSLFFAAMHGHKAINLAFFSFFLSMFWGWLYSKQHTLASVCFSHMLIGTAATYLIGIQQLLS